MTNLKSKIKKLGYDADTAAFISKKIERGISDAHIERIFNNDDTAAQKKYCEIVLDSE